MRQDLNLLLALLNDTSTSGKKSLNNLLASIQIVERLLQSPEVEGNKENG